MSTVDRDDGSRTTVLTEVVLHTLELLARKQAGEDIAFVNIAAARTLCDLGLASRSHEGWDITADGAAELRHRASLRSRSGTSDLGVPEVEDIREHSRKPDSRGPR
jgi:hypothetical protein